MALRAESDTVAWAKAVGVLLLFSGVGCAVTWRYWALSSSRVSRLGKGLGSSEDVAYFARSAPATAVCAVLIFGGGYWLKHLGGIGSRIGLVMGLAGVAAFLPLYLTTTFLGRPRMLIPPAVRDIEGPVPRLLKRWRRRGEHER